MAIRVSLKLGIPLNNVVLSTYRDVVYTELFNDPQREPNMDFLPKTLIFALNEAHATNIVPTSGQYDPKVWDRIY